MINLKKGDLVYHKTNKQLIWIVRYINEFYTRPKLFSEKQFNRRITCERINKKGKVKIEVFYDFVLERKSS